MNGLLKPSSDFVFASLFGEEKHKRVLVCLLNSILKGKPTIESITLVNPQHKKKRKDGRAVTLDIEAVTNDKTVVDIEIQCKRDGNLVNRALNHQARVMRDELNAGDTFDSMPDVIAIWLTDYDETYRKYHTHEAVYMFKENPLDGIEIASEKTRIFIIELPKIDNKKASLNDLFSIWMFFLKNPELIPDEFVKKVPEVHEALEELKVLSADDEFRADYRAHIKARNDMISRETNAEARGKAEGIAEGELRKAKETALKMLSKGMDVEDIAEMTGLPPVQIKALQK